MYERSAIVLERYFEGKLGLNKKSNLKINYENFKTIVEEMQRYQTLVQEEEQIIREFDRVAGEIQNIQKTQEKLYKTNQKLEDDRNKLFNNLDEDPISLEKKLDKIGDNIDKNNEDNKALKANFIQFLTEFIERQRERNKYAKSRRLAEANNINSIEKATKEWEEIEKDIIRAIKESTLYEEDIEEQLSKIMINNGKDEKVGFNQGVINVAIKARLNIAVEEAQCYALIYDRMRKLLMEIENDTLKIAKYQKVMRDTCVKLAFLEAKKDYIVRFLDNERMTAINGAKVHKKMMEEACENFEADIIQIDNLYELIIRETTGKANKKSYKELYNKTYLKEIQEKEKNFEQEVNRIKIHAGTIINSNYWRIEGIKNAYEVFLKEVSENFERDLSEYTLEEAQLDDMDLEEIDLDKLSKNTKKIKINNLEDDDLDEQINMKNSTLEDEEEREEYEETDNDEEDYNEDRFEDEDDDEVDLDEFDFGDDDDEEDDDEIDFEEDTDEEDDDYDEEDYEDNYGEDNDDDYEEEESNDDYDDSEIDIEEDFEEDLDDDDSAIIKGIKSDKKKSDKENKKQSKKFLSKIFSDKNKKKK